MTDDEIFERIRRMGFRVPSYASLNLNTIDPIHNKVKVYSAVGDVAVVPITDNIDGTVETLLRALNVSDD